MFLVNGQEFEDNDLTPAVLELTGKLSESQMADLIDFLMGEWRDASQKGAALMIREGYQSLQLGHISDCVDEEDGNAFIQSIEQFIAQK